MCAAPRRQLPPFTCECEKTPENTYGLWVSVSSLAFAADAFKATQPQLLVLDMIMHRRQTSTLAFTSTARSIGCLPNEVIEMIRNELIGLEIDSAEQQAVKTINCGTARCNCKGCKDGHTFRTRWEMFSASGICEKGFCFQCAKLERNKADLIHERVEVS